ncbi:MAG: hypothetical protein JWO97_2539 [Acidobacteria bacterium]|nr:hypothetical protein [Acidobacteriota bacterium]
MEFQGMIPAMRRLIPLVFVALIVAMWGVGLAVGRRAVDDAASAPWPLQLGSLRDVPARYPKHNASSAALALGPLEARLGIRLNRFDKRPVTNEERAFSLVKEPLSKWLSAEQASTSDAISPPPAELAKYLDDHRADIDAVRDHLLSNEGAIAWPVDLSRLFDAPLPNLLAHMSVTRLLAASALAHGDWDYLHASWLLTRVLWPRPETISVLIARATTSMLCAAARKLPAPAPAWFAEIGQYDYRRAMTAAEQCDAWLLLTKMRDDPFNAESVPRRILTFPFLPFARIWAADLANRERSIAEQLTMIRDCAVDGDAFDRRMKAAVPKFHVYSRVTLPAWGSMWQRISRLRVETELASRNWPATAPDVIASQCTDGSWSYSNGDLHLSREIATRAAAFPLHYSR